MSQWWVAKATAALFGSEVPKTISEKGSTKTKKVTLQRREGTKSSPALNPRFWVCFPLERERARSRAAESLNVRDRSFCLNEWARTRRRDLQLNSELNSAISSAVLDSLPASAEYHSCDVGRGCENAAHCYASTAPDATVRGYGIQWCEPETIRAASATTVPNEVSQQVQEERRRWSGWQGRAKLISSTGSRGIANVAKLVGTTTARVQPDGMRLELVVVR